MKSLSGRPWLRRRVWRKSAIALGHLLLALAVLSGIGHARARYFYCDALGLMPSDPCVQASPAQRGPDETLNKPLADCCEVLTLPGLPEGARTSSPTVPPAERSAVLPAGWLPDRSTAHTFASPNPLLQRWRPPPRDPSEARTRLMVFLT